MDLRTNQWRREMLGALDHPGYRDLAWLALPRITDHFDPVGPLSASLVAEAGLDPHAPPLIFPTSDDQQAGLIGGGAVDAGQMAIILGTSAVVNSSSSEIPRGDQLDVMRLNWGPYLWMRCYNNGAQFLNKIVGKKPNWSALDEEARAIPPGCEGAMVLPFVYPEPSLDVNEPSFRWMPKQPTSRGIRFRAALEALAYLIALGVRQHERAGQKITRITVSGGVAKSALMCEILASVLDHPLELLVSDEGPALGAAVTAYAALENQGRGAQKERTSFKVGDAVARMVRFRATVQPNSEWHVVYKAVLRKFEKATRSSRK
jgi:xylulokinase